MKRIALTGGIACGKSLASAYLRELGAEIIDADDIVHGIFPDPAERRRLAAEVFADPVRRRELEAKVHPVVKAEIDRFLAGGESGVFRLAAIPLLFEVRWEQDFDIICCISSRRDLQISRMTETRGYSREEAEARLAAQLPVAEKAQKSHYVIENDGSAEELKLKVAQFMEWLKEKGK